MGTHRRDGYVALVVEPSSTTTPPAASRRLWRQYWRFDLPVLASVHATFLLGALLLAHAITGRGTAAAGAVTMWFFINAWRARPGAEDTPDWRTHGRRHIPGVIAVPREGPEPAAQSSPTQAVPAAQPTRDSTPTPREDVLYSVYATALVSVDASVVVVLAGVVAWPGWVTVLAVALLTVHVWLAHRVLRNARHRRTAAASNPEPVS